MATEEFRNHLGETKDEALRRLKNDRAKTNKNFENWDKALEAFALGWRKPKTYFPVVISPNSPVSTPQKLQELAGMTAPPEVINTTYTTMDGGLDSAHLQADGQAEEVQVGQVGWHELVKVTTNAECDDWLFVYVGDKIRAATMVKSFKADDKN